VIELAFALLAAHALCDFALQPEAMGRGKCRSRAAADPDIPGYPQWYYWLIAHSLVHGGAVYLVTGLWWLGALETVLHAILDHLKCEGRITVHQDQLGHVLCKAAYLLLLL
jgi:hypothetical protein